MKKSKALIAIAVAGLFSTAAIADRSVFYSQASEENPIHDTLDMKTGGYQGWGPMANPVSPAADNESTVQRDQDLIKERQQHLAEVNRERDRTWAANEFLRSPYDSPQAMAAYKGEQATAVGATRSSGGGFLQRFFRRGE